MKSLVAEIAALLFLLAVASIANASALKVLADSYLHESIVTTAFDIESQMNALFNDNPQFCAVDVLVELTQTNFLN